MVADTSFSAIGEFVLPKYVLYPCERSHSAVRAVPGSLWAFPATSARAMAHPQAALVRHSWRHGWPLCGA